MTDRRNSMATMEELLEMARQGDTQGLIRQVTMAQETLRGAHMLMGMNFPTSKSSEDLRLRWRTFLESHKPPEDNSEATESFIKSLDNVLDEVTESAIKNGAAPQEKAKCECPVCRRDRGEQQCSCDACSVARTLHEKLIHPMWGNADLGDIMELANAMDIPLTPSQIEDVRFVLDSLEQREENRTAAASTVSSYSNGGPLSDEEISAILEAIASGKGAEDQASTRPQHMSFAVGITPDGRRVVLPIYPQQQQQIPPQQSPPQQQAANDQQPKIIIINM